MLEVVNRDSKGQKVGTTSGQSAAELLDDIKFGSQAVFSDASNNVLPSWDDIEVITDRSREESDSIGKLKGDSSHSADTFDAKMDFLSTGLFEGKDFKTLRREQERKRKAEIPKNLEGIGHLWNQISQLSKKRAKKSRIMMVDGKDSGYGKSSVPVLVSNNYGLEHGEQSVFDRELSHQSKDGFEVKKKQANVAQFDNFDFCQVRIVSVESLR